MVVRCRNVLSVVLLLIAATVSGCGQQGGAVVPARPSAQSRRGTVVATVAQAQPGDALRVYLHGWMLRFNDKALGGHPSSSEASWTPEQPDDFVSVVPAVSMSDFATVAAWSASVKTLGAVSKTHAAYRADFQFWRGNPASSAGTGAEPFAASATYDLTWDESKRAWVITQTSEAPDAHMTSDSPRSP